MELVKRITLHYQDQTSDKIYQVDLCKIGDDLYVVNFRYGRRGQSLKEGTKTVQPVSFPQADTIYSELIKSKTKKGYRSTSATAANPPETKEIAHTKKTVTVASNDPRHQAILNHLAANQDERKWPLERAIWRAGELKIREAVPLLLKLISEEKPLRDYCIAWALGNCGDRAAIPVLKSLQQAKSTPDFVSRIAWFALFKLEDSATREEMVRQKIEQLPLALRELARNGSAETFQSALEAYLDTTDYRHFACLDTIYQIDNQYVRGGLINILRTAPLQPNYFKAIRHIFKMAEYRHDGEVFAILARAFEVSPGTFKNHRSGGWYWDSNQKRSVQSKERFYTKELQKPNSSKAYSEQTRAYLQRRVWRTLKTLGEDGDDNYIKLAVEVLLQYEDADGEPIKESNFSRYNRQTRSYDSRYVKWDTYASCLNLNHILYENSPRYEPHSKAWRCKDGYSPGDPEPEAREEAFPQLWDRHPEALLRLLRQSECFPVHHFAVKALQDKEEYCRHHLDIPTIIQLLGKFYEVTVEFAFHHGQHHYNPLSPNLDLVLAVANSILAEVREEAYKWIEAGREYFFQHGEFMAQLVTNPQPDTRNFARKLLGASILEEDTVKLLIARILAILLSLDLTQTQIAREASETLLLCFTPQLRSLGLEVILDLLDHPLGEIQVLGVRILLNHQTPAVELPPDLIESLLSSPHESVRSVGMRIFGQLPDERLTRDLILIIAMAVNSRADIRQGIRPLIRRLATNNPDFALDIAIDFIDLLTEPERHEGVHRDLVTLLQAEIPGWLPHLTTDKAMSLIRAKSSAAQNLGGIVLQENRDRFWSRFTTKELVKLANHEIAAIREAARQMFALKIDSIRHNNDEMLAAVKLLESKWKDSQEFASSLFSKFQPQDWTPEIMIRVCDSNKEDVRRFGRDLVMSNFQQESGDEYLLKFSEHPSSDMQMFATNYLETNVVNDEERFVQLVPYFVTVLSGVNKGSVAKKRIFSFLAKVAEESESAAKIVAEILTRQSVTMAVRDKAQAIQIMLKIKRQYSNIEVPLRVKEIVELRC